MQHEKPAHRVRWAAIEGGANNLSDSARFAFDGPAHFLRGLDQCAAANVCHKVSLKLPFYIFTPEKSFKLNFSYIRVYYLLDTNLFFIIS